MAEDTQGPSTSTSPDKLIAQLTAVSNAATGAGSDTPGPIPQAGGGGAPQGAAPTQGPRSQMDDPATRPRTGLGQPQIDPRAGHRSLGAEIGLGLLSTFVPVVGGIVARHMAANKEGQIMQAVNEWQTLDQVMQEASIRAENDPKKMQEFMQQDPRITAMFNGPQGQKRLKNFQKTFQAIFSSPFDEKGSKGKDQVHYQGLQRFLQLKPASKMMEIMIGRRQAYQQRQGQQGGGQPGGQQAGQQNPLQGLIQQLIQQRKTQYLDPTQVEGIKAKEAEIAKWNAEREKIESQLDPSKVTFTDLLSKGLSAEEAFDWIEKHKAEAKPDTATQHKQEFEGIVNKAMLGMSPGSIDPKLSMDVTKLTRMLQSSNNLTDDEKRKAISYLVANPTPAQQAATRLQVVSMQVAPRWAQIDIMRKRFDLQLAKETGMLPTVNMMNRGQFAAANVGHITKLRQLLEQADQKGLLGPIKGRAYEFMVGGIGSTGNAETDRFYAQLRSELKATASGLNLIHFGGRAGKETLKYFADAIGGSMASKAAFEGYLDTWEQRLQGYIEAGQYESLNGMYYGGAPESVSAETIRMSEEGDFDKQMGLPQKPPKVGEIEDGYRFLGGNPKDQKNWKFVGGK